MRKKNFGFEIKKDSNIKAIEITGMANAATPDRIGDLIEPKSWDLQNFESNPIIFFNHDRNIPIGKAVGTKVSDDGLEITARISKSKEAPIPFIRDMIEEGILKTFSVGFDDHGTSYQDKSDGLTKFEKAELLEVSVVTIPMNQDSLFSVKKDGPQYLAKAFDANINDWKNKSYDEVKKEALELSGKLVAAAVTDAMEGQDKDLVDVLKRYLDKDMLNGLEDPDDAFIYTASTCLGLDPDSLLKLRAKELEEEEEEEEEAEEKYSAEENEEEKSEDEPKEDEEKEDDEDEEKSEDEPKEDEEKDVSDNKDFNECVNSKIPKLIDEGKSREDAVAIAINMCQDSKNCEINDSDLESFLDLAKKSEDTPLVPAEPSSATTMPEGQPGIELQKSALALQGSMLTAQKAANQVLADMLGTLKSIEARLSNPTPQASASEVSEEDEELQKQIDEINLLQKRVDLLLK